MKRKGFLVKIAFLIFAVTLLGNYGSLFPSGVTRADACDTSKNCTGPGDLSCNCSGAGCTGCYVDGTVHPACGKCSSGPGEIN